MGFSYGFKLFGGGGAGSSTSPGGANTQVQFNDGGAFGGDSGLTYVKATDTLTIASAGALNFSTDIGLARASAGLLKVTSGGSNLGSLQAGNLTATALATPGSITVTPTLTRTCTITTVAGADLVDGDYFTIDYGSGTFPVEFDATPGDGTTGGRVAYVFAPGDSADDIRDGLITLINAGAGTALTASSGGAATINLVLDTPGAAGGANSENVGAAAFAITAWADPVAATTYTYKLVARLNDGTTTEAGAASSTASGHATLSAANYNALSWAAVTNAASYDVYRTVGGATQGKIAAATTALTLNDTGLAGGGETTPTTNGTGRVVAKNGGAGSPGFAFVGDTTYGLYRPGADQMGFGGEGVPALLFSIEANPGGSYGSIRLGYSGQLQSSGGANTSTMDAFFSRAAAATWQLGAAASATPVAQTLQAQGGSGTDIAGANLTIQSGAGTGAATGSTVYIKTPDAHGSDAVAQTQTTRMTISPSGVLLGAGALYSVATAGTFLISGGGAKFNFDTIGVYPNDADARAVGYSTLPFATSYLTRATLGSKSTALTDATATTFATFTIADGETYAGEIIYKVTMAEGAAGGARQVLAGRARFAATREGSTYTTSISQVGTETVAANAGTLVPTASATGGISISAAAGVVTLKADYDTSQASPDVFKIDWRFDSCDAGLTITPVA